MLLLLLSPCRTNWKKQVQLAVTSCLGQKAKSSYANEFNPFAFPQQWFQKGSTEHGVCSCVHTQISVSGLVPLMGYRNHCLALPVKLITLILATEELKAVLIRIFWHAGTHHRSQNGEEEGGGGHVAGALGEGGDEEAQEEGNGWVRDALQRGQLGAQPRRQTRFLQQSRERCQVGEGRATSVLWGSSHASSALPSQSSSHANTGKHSQCSQAGLSSQVNKKPQHYFPSKELEGRRSCIYIALLTANNYFSVQIITCTWSVFEVLFYI